jgi:hypothetical protein
MGSQANQNGEPAALDMLGKPAKRTLFREVKSVSLVVVVCHTNFTCSGAILVCPRTLPSSNICPFFSLPNAATK